jgi:hypothetical protein
MASVRANTPLYQDYKSGQGACLARLFGKVPDRSALHGLAPPLPYQVDRRCARPVPGAAVSRSLGTAQLLHAGNAGSIL